MKQYIFSLILLVFSLSCNEGKEKTADSENPYSDSTSLNNTSSEEDERNEEKTTAERNNSEANIGDDLNSQNREESEVDIEQSNPEIKTSVSNDLFGHYKKIAPDGKGTGTACNCDCIDLSTTSNFEMCVMPDKIYITARCEKTGANTADVYLVSIERTGNLERDLPWDKFDKTVPIATVERLSDGNMELDWKGFSIDGELAVDYAIFGKKALEGTYKKG